MSTIPEFMPVLSTGVHDHPSEGACVMEYVSLLAGEDFSDSPACTHPVLARAAQVVNDQLSDEDRHLLVPLIGRLIGTADTRESKLDRKVLSVRLAAWCARRVLHLTREQDREACLAAIEAAEAWADNPTGELAAAKAAKAAAKAAKASANAAAYAAVKAAAVNAVNAKAATAHVGFLTGLLDYHAELTGHVARGVTDGELRALAGAVGA